MSGAFVKTLKTDCASIVISIDADTILVLAPMGRRVF